MLEMHIRAAADHADCPKSELPSKMGVFYVLLYPFKVGALVLT